MESGFGCVFYISSATKYTVFSLAYLAISTLFKMKKNPLRRYISN